MLKLYNLMRTTKQKQQKARKTLRDRRVWSAGSSIRNAQRALRKPKPVEITVVPSPVYTAYNGKSFRFNDHVCVEMLFGVPDEERTGRLVQVRKGCGQFGSDLYFIRLRDESLMTFENAMIRKVDDTEFEDMFYRANGRTPPNIPHQEPMKDDTEEVIYTLKNKWPESGFIVEKPTQPQTPGSFAMAISPDSVTISV